jgi:hypothetical protein
MSLPVVIKGKGCWEVYAFPDKGLVCTCVHKPDAVEIAGFYAAKNVEGRQ